MTYRDYMIGSNISIHAPREGGDTMVDVTDVSAINFNPRPPRGGRLSDGLFVLFSFLISIHAPREGGDFLCG